MTHPGILATVFRLKRLETIVVVAACLITIGTTGWKFANDYFQLRLRVDAVERKLAGVDGKVDGVDKDATVFRHYMLVPASGEVYRAGDFTGSWVVRYAGRTGKLGVVRLDDETMQFKGEINDRRGILHVTGQGTLERERDLNYLVNFHFISQGEKNGEQWNGTGVLKVLSTTFLQGWYDDQFARHENFEVRREF